MPLDACPFEIQVLVAEFACLPNEEDDPLDKQTALALCLLCRQFRVIATPILYRIVVIIGRERTQLLSRTLLEPSSSQLARHVRTLFLSDVYPNMRTGGTGGRNQRIDEDDALIMPSFVFSFPATHQGRLDRQRRLQNWLTSRAHTLALFQHARYEIVRCVSQFVTRLTVLRYDEHYGSQQIFLQAGVVGGPNDLRSGDDQNGLGSLRQMLRLEYPRLRELTVRNPAPFPGGLQMPALERLHLAAGGDVVAEGAWRTVFEVVQRRCRHLQELRISDPPSVLPVAAALLSLPGMVSNLRRVVLRTVEPLVQEQAGHNTSATATPAVETLQRLEAAHPNIEIVRSTSGRDEVRYSFGAASREWVDRTKEDNRV